MTDADANANANEHHHIALVGAGPIGLELAAALKRAGFDYVHFEKAQVGQTMFLWPPETHWFSSNERIAIAGVPLLTTDQTKATREQYLAYLRTVVQTFQLDVRTYEPVIDIHRDPETARFTLVTQPAAGTRRCSADRLVLAVGDTDLPRTLDIPGEDLPHVSHSLHDPHRYFRNRVLVVGGKNSAAEAALRLYHVGARVTLSYRGESLQNRGIKAWVLPELQGRIARGEILAHFNTRPTRITPTHVALEPAGSHDPPGAPVDLPADFVLLMTGYLADMTLFRKAGVTLQGQRQIPRYDPETMMTDVPNLYVAGTAVAGTQQNYSVFLENCHIHVDRILAHLQGGPPPREHRKWAGAPET